MEQKNKEETEDLCCSDKDVCDIRCAPKKEEETPEFKCKCGGNC